MQRNTGAKTGVLRRKCGRRLVAILLRRLDDGPRRRGGAGVGLALGGGAQRVGPRRAAAPAARSVLPWCSTGTARHASPPKASAYAAAACAKRTVERGRAGVQVVDGDAARRERAAHVGDKRRRDERRRREVVAVEDVDEDGVVLRVRRRRRPRQRVADGDGDVRLLEAEARGGGVDDGGVELAASSVASGTWRRSSSGSVPAPSPRKATRGAAPSAPDARPTLARLLTYSLATHRGSAVPAPTICVTLCTELRPSAPQKRSVRQPPRCSCTRTSVAASTDDGCAKIGVPLVDHCAADASQSAGSSKEYCRCSWPLRSSSAAGATASQSSAQHSACACAGGATASSGRLASAHAGAHSASDSASRSSARAADGSPGGRSGAAAPRARGASAKRSTAAIAASATAGPSHSWTKPDWTASGAWRPAACRRRAPSRGARARRPPTRRRWARWAARSLGTSEGRAVKAHPARRRRQRSSALVCSRIFTYARAPRTHTNGYDVRRAGGSPLRAAVRPSRPRHSPSPRSHPRVLAA